MHDAFGLPRKIETAADLAAVETGNDLFLPGMPWGDYKRWRREVARNTASEDMDEVWCRGGDDCGHSPRMRSGRREDSQ